jgi:hypothetical protein
MEIEADDERMITVKLSDTTKKPEHLIAGDEVEVDALQDDNGLFTATNVTRTKAAAHSESAPASGSTGTAPQDGAAAAPRDDRPTTTMATKVQLDPGDDGPPTLKHGKPKKYEEHPVQQVARNEIAAQPLPSVENTSTPEAAAPEAPKTGAHSAFIEQAREVAGNFTESLPNFYCRQFTTRYESTHKADWQPIDLVQADLIYDNHKERYQNLLING